MNGEEIANKWIKQVSGLVSPPDICIRVFELIESQTASIKQIGEVISQDPNLSARLLKIVNSPYYHFSTRIDTISRAITVVGIRELSSLIIAISAVKTFSNIPNHLVNIDTFWRHSIYTALIARALATRCDVLHPERLFVSGLLHDIGSLIIYNRVPDMARELLMQANGNEMTLYEKENNTIGLTHAYLGGRLLESWMLPKILRDSITYHHEPGRSKLAPLESAILHIAEALANRSILGAFCENPCGDDAIDPEAWAALPVNEEDIDVEQLIGDSGLQFSEMSHILGN